MESRVVGLVKNFDELSRELPSSGASAATVGSLVVATVVAVVFAARCSASGAEVNFERDKP